MQFDVQETAPKGFQPVKVELVLETRQQMAEFLTRLSLPVSVLMRRAGPCGELVDEYGLFDRADDDLPPHELFDLWNALDKVWVDNGYHKTVDIHYDY